MIGPSYASRGARRHVPSTANRNFARLLQTEDAVRSVLRPDPQNVVDCHPHAEVSERGLTSDESAPSRVGEARWAWPAIPLRMATGWSERTDPSTASSLRLIERVDSSAVKRLAARTSGDAAPGDQCRHSRYPTATVRANCYGDVFPQPGLAEDHVGSLVGFLGTHRLARSLPRHVVGLKTKYPRQEARRPPPPPMGVTARFASFADARVTTTPWSQWWN
jgi:hypothetical protein